jgi:hypothetical protein
LKEEMGNKIINPMIFICPKTKKVMIKKERKRIRTYLDQEPKKSDAPMLKKKRTCQN